jgi:hypothetical protein
MVASVTLYVDLVNIPHTFIKIDDGIGNVQFFGLGPLRPNSPWGAAAVGIGLPSQFTGGVANSNPAAYRPEDASYIASYQVTEQKLVAMMDAVQAWIDNPGTYVGLGSNCTTFVRAIFNAGEVAHPDLNAFQLFSSHPQALIPFSVRAEYVRDTPLNEFGPPAGLTDKARNPVNEWTDGSFDPVKVIGALLSVNSSEIDGIEDLLATTLSPVTPGRVTIDASTALGVGLGYWTTDLPDSGTSVAAGYLGLSGFGALDGLSPLTLLQVPSGASSTGVPQFTLNPNPFLPYGAPVPSPVNEVLVTAPPEARPQDYTYFDVLTQNTSGLPLYIHGAGWVGANGETVAIADGGQVLGFVNESGFEPDYEVTPFSDPGLGDFWTDPGAFGLQGTFDFGGFAPLVLDLDGNGFADFAPVETSTAYFDADSNGNRNRMGWAGPNDGVLAYDHDGNGIVTRADEISFTAYKAGATTDLEGLQTFDTNQDGSLNAGDALFGRFGVWVDANQDGIAQAGEYRSLAAAGITSVSTASTGTPGTINGATIHGYSTYTTASGTHAVADVSFQASREVAAQPQDNTLTVIALDLDGDGVYANPKAQSGVVFDVDNDGFMEATGWLNANDAMLVLDRNGDGRIESASELVTTDTTSAAN